MDWAETISGGGQQSLGRPKKSPLSRRALPSGELIESSGLLWSGQVVGVDVVVGSVACCCDERPERTA